MLSSQQLSILHEMGIPVWEERLAAAEIETGSASIAEPANTPQQKAEYQSEIRELPESARYFIIVDNSEFSQLEKRLLQAMLRSVNIAMTEVFVLSISDFRDYEAALSLAEQQRLLLLLGDNVASSVIGINAGLGEHRGQTYRVSDNLEAIVSFSLQQLINTPENKASAWQDLLRCRAYYSQATAVA